VVVLGWWFGWFCGGGFFLFFCFLFFLFGCGSWFFFGVGVGVGGCGFLGVGGGGVFFLHPADYRPHQLPPKCFMGHFFFGSFLF